MAQLGRGAAKQQLKKTKSLLLKDALRLLCHYVIYFGNDSKGVNLIG